MQSPIGQLVAAKDDGRWILGMVMEPVRYDFDRYYIEWYYTNNVGFLITYHRSMHMDTLQEYLRAYQNKVRAKIYRGIFRQES